MHGFEAQLRLSIEDGSNFNSLIDYHNYLGPDSPYPRLTMPKVTEDKSISLRRRTIILGNSG
jgi:hypothetical protein